MRRVVFTNGVFDVLHIGHLKLLEFCKRQGDYLVVAIDSDNRVKQTKGQNRPVYGEQERKSILEAIRHVDEVIVFDSMDDLRNLHRTIQPDVVVKGSDWSRGSLDGDGICTHSQVVSFPVVEGHSTTSTLHRIRSLSSCEKVAP